MAEGVSANAAKFSHKVDVATGGIVDCVLVNAVNVSLTPSQQFGEPLLIGEKRCPDFVATLAPVFIANFDNLPFGVGNRWSATTASAHHAAAAGAGKRERFA